MHAIPSAPGLPVHYLALAFDNVTNSYKFLWFLAILDEVEEGTDGSIAVTRLLGRMVASAWYPVNYFRLSFGKQDLMARLVTEMLTQEKAPLNALSSQVTRIATLEIESMSDLGRELGRLAGYVPYRFIRPFFAEALRGTLDAHVNRRISELARSTLWDSTSPVLYRLSADDNREIELHPDWLDYMRRHLAILRGFAYWHLLNYLQLRNPGVPSLATKLFAPQARNLTQARRMWRIVFDRLRPITCIYSGEAMFGDAYSLDHFLPWRFVAHDSLWNIVPTPSRVNSSKGDRLPDLASYFDQLASLQYDAMHAVLDVGRHERLLEDYLFLLNQDSTASMTALPREQFRRALHDTVAPQMQIALNLGFQGGWTY